MSSSAESYVVLLGIQHWVAVGALICICRVGATGHGGNRQGSALAGITFAARRPKRRHFRPGALTDLSRLFRGAGGRPGLVSCLTAPLSGRKLVKKLHHAASLPDINGADERHAHGVRAAVPFACDCPRYTLVERQSAPSHVNNAWGGGADRGVIISIYRCARTGASPSLACLGRFNQEGALHCISTVA